MLDGFWPERIQYVHDRYATQPARPHIGWSWMVSIARSDASGRRAPSLLNLTVPRAGVPSQRAAGDQRGQLGEELIGVARWNEYAHGYLLATSFTDGEVSFMLGFEDANSFDRAFRSWNGVSANEFRRQTQG